MKVKVSPGKRDGEWQAMFHADGWDRGYYAGMAMRRIPPVGYRLTGLSLRKNGSGKRVDVKILIRHVDRRMPAISKAEMEAYMVSVWQRGQQ